MAARGRDIDGPVAGAADVGLAALLDALEGAVIDLVVVLALGGADQLAEFVVEALVAEIALFLGDPFLQPEMRFDHELGHGDPPLAAGRPSGRFLVDCSIAQGHD